MPVVIVSGATGLLGRAVVSCLEENLQDHTIVRLGFSRCVGDGSVRKCDLTNSNDIEKLFAELQPVVFVHCAAERRPDIVESGNPAAKALNISATKLIADACHKRNCYLVYMSTDYVFDGTSPPYNENSVPNPLNSYGCQKLEGEKIVLNANLRNVVVRVPVLYGPLDPKVGLDESAVTTIFKAVKNSSCVAKMDHVAIRFPTLTSDIALVIRNIVENILSKSNLVSGIVHVSGQEHFTKYEMACRMAEMFNLPLSHIVPDVESAFKTDTKRPVNAKLACNRAKDLKVMVNMVPFDEGIKNCLSPYI